MDDREARQRVVAVEAALERLESLPEGSRAAAHEAVAGILELYGEALRRVMAEAGRNRECSSIVRFARTDELVCHLLLLHGLHPDGEEPLRKLYAAEAQEGREAAAGRARPAGPAEPELVALGSRRRAGGPGENGEARAGGAGRPSRHGPAPDLGALP